MNEDIKIQYRLRFSKVQQYRNKVWEILIESFFQQYIPDNSDILDVGCGWGEFINNIKGRKKFGIDLNSDAKQHLEPSVEFINQDCSNQWPLSDESLDVVFTSNFLEHLPSKPHIENTIAQARRCLKPKGLLLCLGPNIKYLPGLYWDFWDHHIEITEASLSELLKMNDFSILKCVGRFLPYTMANEQTPPLFLVKLYLSFPILWKLFGKQFLIVARKTES